MPHKERIIIPSRYSKTVENQELIYELVRSKRLKKGQLSVIVQNDLSVSVIAHKDLNIDEINEIICLRYSEIEYEIEKIKNKRL